MQGRWLIATFTVVLGLLCLHQLSYTWYVNSVESNAKEISLQSGKSETQILKDSLGLDTLNLGITKYNYFDAKKKEMKLGLDLKGGINTVLQVSVKDLLINLSNQSKSPVFNDALKAADIKQKNDTRPYLEIFFDEFEQASQGKVLLSSTDVFGHFKNKELIPANLSDTKTKDILSSQIESQVSTAYQVIRSRIDQFGVSQPVVQRLGDKADGRILVELPGVKDTERVREILQKAAVLEFWEVIAPDGQINNFISSLNVKLPQDSVAKPLYALLNPSPTNAIATVNLENKEIVDSILKSKPLPRSMAGQKFAFANQAYINPETKQATNQIELFALKGNRDGTPLLGGDVIQSAEGVRNQGTIAREPVVSMSMNTEGSQKWAKITGDLAPVGNKYRYIGVVLDNKVYSAPRILGKIVGGNTQIQGNFTMEEAEDLASVLEAGSLPASASIIQEAVVGPSLGKESIQKGIFSFIAALLIVLVWMIFYYSGAGIYSDIALVVNMLFLFGLLASFGAVLTLPGIAGVILTIGMAVDANVIIYERVKEELLKGKNIKQAISVAYSWKGAISAIVDANVTTFLTALVLFFFGDGPVKGFATTLIIGIFSSMFCAIFLTRYFIEGKLSKEKNVSFYTKLTKNWFRDLNIDFLGKRKITYIISGTLLVVSLLSLTIRSLNFGIDFVGGRNYIVRFDQPVKANEVASILAKSFGEEGAPEVKTFGNDNQLKITTKYKINEDSPEVTNEIQSKLFNSLKPYLPNTINQSSFVSPSKGATIGIMSSNKVGPTIADDIKTNSLYAVLGSMVIVFLYILFRFRKWQFSTGAVAAVFHDVIIVLGMFSLFHSILPFSLEIDQAFIAAILTVIGYSLNDTVIVFDRIREFLEEHPKMPFGKLINKSINATLSRTINTSLTTLFVVLVIFLFGGETIRGFMFALLLGIVVGTYSSVFIATPLMYDLTKKTLKNREA